MNAGKVACGTGKASENGQYSGGIAKCHTDKTVGGHKLCS